MEPHLIQELSPKVLEFKKCDKTRVKRFKFWKNLAQTHTRELSHKILNVRTGLKVISKKEELHNARLNT
jgi:hypothetical protein